MYSRAEHGLTLVELLVFIVIVGIAVDAMMAVFARLSTNSATLLADKQSQALAEGMLNEVMAQPYTFCDPLDPNASTATSPLGCTPGKAEVPGPELGETRGGPVPFNNVNDYNGFSTTGDVLAGIPGLAAYNVSVSVAQAAAPISGVPAADILLVTVTVTPPVGAPIHLEGVRMQYAPQT